MEYWARIIVLIIDTHAHVFSSDERQFPPRENPSRPPQGSGTFAGLLDEVERHDISAVTLVQVSGFYGFDHRYVCSAARENPHWTAGICTLDPENERSPGLLKTYARESNVRGMRSIPASGKRLDHSGVRALWKTAADLGLVINILGGYELEPQIDTLLQDFPTLRVALDHSLGLAVGGPNEKTPLEAQESPAVSRDSNASRSTRTCTTRFRSSPTAPVDAQTISLAAVSTRQSSRSSICSAPSAAPGAHTTCHQR